MFEFIGELILYPFQTFLDKRDKKKREAYETLQRSERNQAIQACQTELKTLKKKKQREELYKRIPILKEKPIDRLITPWHDYTTSENPMKQLSVDRNILQTAYNQYKDVANDNTGFVINNKNFKFKEIKDLLGLLED